MVWNFRPLPLTGACPGQCPSCFFLIGPKDVFIRLPGRFDRLQAVALFFKSVILVLSSVFFSLCLFSFLLLSSVFFFLIEPRGPRDFYLSPDCFPEEGAMWRTVCPFLLQVLCWFPCFALFQGNGSISCGVCSSATISLSFSFV